MEGDNSSPVKDILVPTIVIVLGLIVIMYALHLIAGATNKEPRLIGPELESTQSSQSAQ